MSNSETTYISAPIAKTQIFVDLNYFRHVDNYFKHSSAHRSCLDLGALMRCAKQAVQSELDCCCNLEGQYAFIGERADWHKDLEKSGFTLRYSELVDGREAGVDEDLQRTMRAAAMDGMEVAILVSGDRDHVQAIRDIQAVGVKVLLVSLNISENGRNRPVGTSLDLRSQADFRIDLEFISEDYLGISSQELDSLFSKNHPKFVVDVICGDVHAISNERSCGIPSIPEFCYVPKTDIGIWSARATENHWEAVPPEDATQGSHYICVASAWCSGLWFFGGQLYRLETEELINMALANGYKGVQFWDMEDIEWERAA